MGNYLDVHILTRRANSILKWSQNNYHRILAKDESKKVIETVGSVTHEFNGRIAKVRNGLDELENMSVSDRLKYMNILYEAEILIKALEFNL